MAQPQQIEKWLIPGLKIAGVAAVLYAGYKVMQKVGLFPTAAETAVETAEADTTASANQTTVNPATEPTKNAMLAFNPNYRQALVKAYIAAYKKPFPVTKQLGAIGQAKIANFAKDLSDSNKWYNDDEDKLYNIFRQIQTQYQLSFLSGIFSTVHKKDLFQYLRGFLKDEEMEKIINIVKGYQQYIK